MRAVWIPEPGDSRVLEIREVSRPAVGDRDLLVRVRAAALNRADLLQRRGLYPAPPGCPAEIPGLEFAGEVQQVGSAVQQFAPGDRVMGLLGGGGQAEYVAVDAALCMPIPEALDWVHAAAVPEAWLTAHDALFRIANLSAEDSVLITAAGSGVGCAAVQLARRQAASVVAVSRTSWKRQRLEELGAQTVADPAAAADHAPRGIDVTLDLVGGEGVADHLLRIAPRGRIIVVGLLGGRRTTIDLARLLSRRGRIEGTVLRSRSLDERAALVAEFTRRQLDGFVSGLYRPIVDRVLAVEQIVEAHEALESNATFGKVVLRFS